MEATIRLLRISPPVRTRSLPPLLQKPHLFRNLCRNQQVVVEALTANQDGLQVTDIVAWAKEKHGNKYINEAEQTMKGGVASICSKIATKKFATPGENEEQVGRKRKPAIIYILDGSKSAHTPPLPALLVTTPKKRKVSSVSSNSSDSRSFAVSTTGSQTRRRCHVISSGSSNDSEDSDISHGEKQDAQNATSNASSTLLQMSAILNVRNGEQSHSPGRTNTLAPAAPTIINPRVSESLQGDDPERDESEMLRFGRIVKELQELASRRTDLNWVIADNQRNLPDRDSLAQCAEQSLQKANELEEEACTARRQAEIAKQDLESAKDKAETIVSD
ncbi:hypothetical protein LTR95_012126, partial [Oleoguttula sp. CCFEE 5521]